MSDLVIDADIMRAAGESEHPHSSNARRLLETIRDAGHRMVQCAPLVAEHKKHQSAFASRWRASMVSRKRWVPWAYQEDGKLREVLVAALPSEATAQLAAVLKDAHLLEAASATDGRVLSKDAKARNLFRRACPALGVNKTILWGDLTGSPEEVIDWVQIGCNSRTDFKLCPVEPRKAQKGTIRQKT